MTIHSKLCADIAGAIRGGVPAPQAVPLARPRSFRGGESPDWCRQRAAADLAAAGETDTANGRLRLERSAGVWTARAALLQRLNDSFEARRLAAVAVRAAPRHPEASAASPALMAWVAPGPSGA